MQNLDIDKELAVCEAATPGPRAWEAQGGSLLDLGMACESIGGIDHAQHVLSCWRCKA